MSTTQLEIPRAPKALRAGYGASDRQKHDNTVKSMACPGARPQEVYTPEPIVEAILKVWDHVEFDPCWGPGSIVPSTTHAYVPPRIEVPLKGKPRVVFRAQGDEVDGLVVRWPDYTYANYPFALARDWLLKAEAEAKFGTEIMVLGPVRPHRRWFRQVERTTARTCYLDPVKFLGHRSALPLPLCLMYWGDRANLFEQVFEHSGLGECL